MAGLLSETCTSSKGKLDSHGLYSRKDLEETPSRRDGISSMKEESLRKSYCAYLLNLGKRLKVPQFTIATAIVLCHRFFLLQSHAKNDRWTIATSCMFLAGKVDGGLYSLRDIIPLYYGTIYKKDPFAAQKIRQKEIYEEQKQLILLGERVVLVTLEFNLIVDHPYMPLQDIVQKFKLENISIVQVAWNLINDGLWSLSWLQFEPHHIAAGAIFLASKFLKVKLSFNGKNCWWLELGMSTWQLKEVSNRLLILYEVQSQAHPPPPYRKRVNARSVRTNDKQPTRKIMAAVEEKCISTSHHPSQAAPNNVGESSLAGWGNQCVPHYEHAANPINGLNLVESQSADLRDQKESGGASQGNGVEEDESSIPFFVVKESTFMERGQNEGGCLKGGNRFCAYAIKNSPTKKVKVVLKKQRKNHGEAMAGKLDPMDANDIVDKELENETEMSKHGTRLQKSTPSMKMYYNAPAKIGQAKHIQGDLCEREAPPRQGYGSENYREERKLSSPLDDPVLPREYQSRVNSGCKRKAHAIPPRRDERGHSYQGRLPQYG